MICRVLDCPYNHNAACENPYAFIDAVGRCEINLIIESEKETGETGGRMEQDLYRYLSDEEKEHFNEILKTHHPLFTELFNIAKND